MAAAEDYPGLRLKDRYTSLDGVTHSVWTQWTRGIEIYDHYLGTNVDAAGRLINTTGNPLRELELNTVTPRLRAREARARARADGKARQVVFEGRLAWLVDGPEETVVVDAADGRILERRSRTAARERGAGLRPLPRPARQRREA